jgi:hypothetical protein
MRGTICIVSPGNLASNPRLLKEVDALHEAGYGVTVVACDYTERLGRERHNWDIETRSPLGSVDSAFTRRRVAA